MELTTIGMPVITFSIIIITWWIINYNNFQDFIIKINEAEANIDSILRKRFDLLNKSISVLKPHIEKKENLFKDLHDLKKEKLSNFDLDRKLYDAINELNLYKEKYPEIKSIEGLIKIEAGINNSEIEIVSSRKYYNDTITDYNKTVKSFPSNIIAFFYKYKHRNFYDDKDMTDEIKNDFKL